MIEHTHNKLWYNLSGIIESHYMDPDCYAILARFSLFDYDIWQKS